MKPRAAYVLERRGRKVPRLLGGSGRQYQAIASTRITITSEAKDLIS